MKKIKYFWVLCIIVQMFVINVHAESMYNSNFAQSAICKFISKGTINLSVNLPSVPASDDNKIYLYELSAFEYDIPQDRSPIMSVDAAEHISIDFPYAKESGLNRLYCKFAVGIKENGQQVMISKPQYISNPEYIATRTHPRKNRGLKSVQGVDFWNVEVSTTNIYPDTVSTVQFMNSQKDGIYTNPLARSSAKMRDTHPASATYYYMPNASENEGIQAMVNNLQFYASDGKLDNFIVGNEVNVRQWNYLSWVDWERYIREYVQVFRVSYNAVKSVNANARVYTCIDICWDRNLPPSHREYYQFIDAKDFLIIFNYMIREEGNIDWSLAQHPYPYPLTCAKFWDNYAMADAAYGHNQVASNKIITFENLSVLTNFMQSPEMLNPSGEVRKISLTEIGITNAQGIDVQAAALCASFVAAERNPYIDEIIYLQDYCGANLNTKLAGKSQEMYINMDGNQAQEYRNWALSYIGIDDWGQILH